MLKNNKNIFKFLVFTLVLSSIVGFVQLASAQINVGTNEIDNNISLSANDPRTVAARVINIAMLFLGILAVGVIVWGGFIWMTSNGDEEKVAQAKKILKNGVIGLVIILSSWGIATFILNRLINSTGNSSSSFSCTDNQSLACGCGGSMTCIGGSWGSCLGSNCSSSSGQTSCDSSPLNGCQASDQICADSSYCDADTCSCLPKGELGDSCDLSPETATCEINNNFCSEYLTCSPDSCTCEGSPVITAISPAGGFCEEDINKSCNGDEECILSCNLTDPNGSAGNIVTISGSNFGSYDPLVSKVIFDGDAVGIMPSEINPECINSWTNHQIIVALPVDVQTGPVTVISADNKSDVSNDNYGPELPDFIVNNIARPGLCLVTPDAGLLSQQVNYQGINLYAGEAFFGSYSKNVAGLDSVFTNPAGVAGTSIVPNLNEGKMSSFVMASISGNQEKSNYVTFVKEREPNTGPYISYFEPVIGRAGQYITIHGGGFGGAQGYSKVFFGDVEADYDFPAVCANSVWRDKQIIVKVPADVSDGSFEIRIELNGEQINSQNANPNVFTVDTNESLKTSICKISPSRGQIGTIVSIWGEYFGKNNDNALVSFTYNKTTSAMINSDDNDQLAQLLEPSVPDNATTGSLKVIKNNEWGNDVNFEVGVCVEDSDCGDEVCCPVNTYKQGVCAPTLASCYVDVPTSVFEWGFSTGYGGGENNVVYDSCQEMAKTLGACQIGSFCPNSPGLCSPYAGGALNLGSCDSTCTSVNACIGQTSGCSFNGDIDTCVLNNAICSPDTSFTYNLNNLEINTKKVCKSFSQFGNQNHFEIKTSSSCPQDWTRLDGGRCVDSISSTESSCSICVTGFTCYAEENSETGVCISPELCKGAAECQGQTCVSQEDAHCDCCCEIGEDVRDCCAPLTCSGTCGSDTSNDGVGFGQCSGCSIIDNGIVNQDLSDQACNCSTSSGKYCDTTIPTGTCLDCSLLSADACLDHSQACCLDSKGTSDIGDDVCVGGNGQAITSDEISPDFGYCARYDCSANLDQTSDGFCASSTPLKLGFFKSIDKCEDTCEAGGNDSICGQYNGDLSSCSASSDCCFNFSDQKCEAGDKTADGYCTYYDCQASPNEGKCNANPAATGTYSTYLDCNIACSQPSLGGLGKDCRSIASSATDCNQSFCSSPFACLNDAGTIGLPGNCGTCCCQVDNPLSCANIGSGNLICQPNTTPCSGDDRGLCCGCSADDNCGNVSTLGCDSGACCRARPAVLTNQLNPAHGASNVCRNVTLQIPFDQYMDIKSLEENILLLEEISYGSGVCPTGTFVVSAEGFQYQRQNWLARNIAKMSYKFSNLFHHLGLSSGVALAGIPDSSKLYCSVPGSISLSQSGNGSLVEFAPKKLLSPGSNYYLVIKGDEALDSNTGVLSQWQIGFNGDGYLDLSSGTYTEGVNLSFNNLTFINSYIVNFTTLSQQGANAGVCAVDYVLGSPTSYLFQTTVNDLNENDADISASNFDTVADKDKLFTANAYSADGQMLHPTSAYYWDWNWDITKPNLASILNVSSLAVNQAFVSATDGVTDDSGVLTAQINMDRFSAPGCNDATNCVCAEPGCFNNCCNLYQDGDGAKANIPLFVFICKNPWPAVNQNDLSWSPWYDTCVGVSSSDCSNYNYKFYYCRDAGTDLLSDDLPAMINPAIIKGGSGIFTCSEGQTACEINDVNKGLCGPDNNFDGNPDGFCVWSVLKESYFFKEEVPTVGAITAAIDLETGSSVSLEWYGDSSLIYNVDANKLGKYRIYYTSITSGNTAFIDVKPNDILDDNINTVCTPLHPVSGSNYSCHYQIDNLVTGDTYSFKVSAISFTQVESALFGGRSVTLTDMMAPEKPLGFLASIATDQRLNFTWLTNNDDTRFYRLYHGINSGQYGESFDSDDNATSLDLDSRQFSAGTHYFALSAIDNAGNESLKSIEVSIIIPVQ
ncbi:IPT/TIG domain-containing protein [Patescibacteria group bacterium]|nr:IPT/TIG domain-containing protein [Patescibacteria group bacterium]